MFVRIILFPFAVLYSFVTSVRNYLYDKGLIKSVSFRLPVIVVGNLTVGGTGKTPHVEYLVRLLKERYALATLSRGYGRKTRGFILAKPGVKAAEIGDEPFQYYRKFHDSATVAVGEKRPEAIEQVLALKPLTQALLLDDAFQHRRLKASFYILLSDYSRPFYKDLLLPAGRLRERRSGAARADIIIVSKCPPYLGEGEMEEIRSKVLHYTGTKPVFFTGFRYGAPVPVFRGPEPATGSTVLVFSGIASPKPFLEEVGKRYRLGKVRDFKDHHFYTSADIEGIRKDFEVMEGPCKFLLTTEKDMVKLLDLPPAVLAGLPLYYLPVEVYFLKGGPDFDKAVISHVEKNFSAGR